MEEIKMKVVSKELNGGTTTADVTMDDENKVTGEVSKQPGEGGGTNLYKHSLTGTGNPITIIDTQIAKITSSNISTRSRQCVRAYTADGSTILGVSGIADGIYYTVISGSQIGGNSISNIVDEVEEL